MKELEYLKSLKLDNDEIEKFENWIDETDNLLFHSDLSISKKNLIELIEIISKRYK